MAKSKIGMCLRLPSNKEWRKVSISKYFLSSFYFEDLRTRQINKNINSLVQVSVLPRDRETDRKKRSRL